MLGLILAILIILWLLGMVSSYTLGGYIHLLLVVASGPRVLREGRSLWVWSPIATSSVASLLTERIRWHTAVEAMTQPVVNVSVWRPS
jgi:hypothetical protein